jgi:hypothetical protein
VLNLFPEIDIPHFGRNAFLRLLMPSVDLSRKLRLNMFVQRNEKNRIDVHQLSKGKMTTKEPTIKLSADMSSFEFLNLYLIKIQRCKKTTIGEALRSQVELKHLKSDE